MPKSVVLLLSERLFEEMATTDNGLRPMLSSISSNSGYCNDLWMDWRFEFCDFVRNKHVLKDLLGKVKLGWKTKPSLSSQQRLGFPTTFRHKWPICNATQYSHVIWST